MDNAAAQAGKRATYPAYRPSGVEWLGEVPEHWEVERLKYVASINDEALAETTDPDYEFHYVDIGNVDSVNGIIGKEAYRFENAPSRARRVVRDGDVIVSTVRTYLRAIAPIREPQDHLIVSTGFAVVRPRKVDSDYLSYALRSPFFVETVVSRSTGVSYPAINASETGTIPIPVPATDEQRAIAAFLDRETGRIDALIEKKQRQIELLQEKRTALISHAVTKGLDPNVPMKDSGIEWLGQMPAHWNVWRIKRVGQIRYGLGEPPEQLADGLLFVRATDIERGRINTSNIQRVDPEDVPMSRAVMLAAGDILVVRSGAYTGDSAIVPPGLAGAIAGYDMVLRVTEAAPQFVAYALLSKYILEGQIYLEKMRAAQPHLNAEELGNCVLLLPPLSEQKAIVEHLNQVTARLDRLVETVKQSVGLLREYLTALISAAVTGKIDVRQAVTATAAARRANPYFRRAVLAAEIAAQLHEEPTFGRVKFQKVLYLCEHHAELPDLETDYRRQAAGPLDRRLMHSVESQMERQGWFRAVERDPYGTQYEPMEKAGGHADYFERYWADRRDAIQQVVDLLRPMKTEQAEIVATLYAAWNDFLIEGEDPDDHQIVREVLDNWDASKQRIAEERWYKALDWMRQKGLVPRGFGEPTKHHDDGKD